MIRQLLTQLYLGLSALAGCLGAFLVLSVTPQGALGYVEWGLAAAVVIWLLVTIFVEL